MCVCLHMCCIYSLGIIYNIFFIILSLSQSPHKSLLPLANFILLSSPKENNATKSKRSLISVCPPFLSMGLDLKTHSFYML